MVRDVSIWFEEYLGARQNLSPKPNKEKRLRGGLTEESVRLWNSVLVGLSK